jgi:putative SOS response-associated peptidase YedK
LPVILEAEDWPLWLGEQGKGAAKLMRPVSDQLLDIKKVSNAVNSNRSTGAALWQPISS